MVLINRELTIELDNGMNVTVDVDVKGVYETDYGADLDGNRGIGVWFIDDVDYVLPTHSDDHVALDDASRNEVVSKLEKLIDDSDWDFNND